jgi:pilus assembly protein CpaB
MKPVSLLILIVAITLGGLATYFGRVIIAQNTQKAPVIESRIVVATIPMSFGTELTDANLAEVPWPATVIPEGAFTSKAEILKEGRRVALTAIAKSEPVLSNKITGSGQRASLAAVLEPGMRAVTIRVDDVRGVAGFVRPGDRVDVILTQNVSGSAVADVLLTNIKILAVDQVANERQENPMVARAVTAEVNTEQAQKLVLAQGVGSLSLVLRQPEGQNEQANRRVTVSDLGNDQPHEKSQIEKLQAQIAELRALAATSGEEGRKEFLYRISQLESRMASELNRNATRATEKSNEPQSKVAKETVVRVTRGVKPEEYRFVGE